MGGVSKHRRSSAARPADLRVHADGQAHRPPQGARDSRPLRRRGLPVLRHGGADPLDRALRPRQGGDARAVRVDADTRRGARRAAPPRLGSALPAPRRAGDQQRTRELPLDPRTPARPRGARGAGGHDPGRADRPPRPGGAGGGRLAQPDRALRRKRHDRADRHPGEPRQGLRPDRAAERREAKERFRRAFARLSKQEREVAVLLLCGGLDAARHRRAARGLREPRLPDPHPAPPPPLRTALRRAAAVHAAQPTWAGSSTTESSTPPISRRASRGSISPAPRRAVDSAPQATPKRRHWSGARPS